MHSSAGSALPCNTNTAPTSDSMLMPPAKHLQLYIINPAP